MPHSLFTISDQKLGTVNTWEGGQHTHACKYLNLSLNFLLLTFVQLLESSESCSAHLQLAPKVLEINTRLHHMTSHDSSYLLSWDNLKTMSLLLTSSLEAELCCRHCKECFRALVSSTTACTLTSKSCT